MKLRFLAAFAALAFVVPQLLADARVDHWIAKARSAVGSEAALNNVRSIHFKGTLETTEPRAAGETGPAKPLVLAIDIVFQKPFQQRMVLRSDEVVETTALDGYDAWVRRANAKDEKKWQITLLEKQQIKRLRANTWENLNFYTGLPQRGGSVVYGGDANLDGRACVKLTFTHAENIAFVRYFDKVSGRLVKTETESGGEIREEGELIVQGLRFPRKLINKAPEGQIATITFESVTINETFPADAFAVPAFSLQN
jgi:outer membrane lipoprotein-sorting protein